MLKAPLFATSFFLSQAVICSLPKLQHFSLLNTPAFGNEQLHGNYPDLLSLQSLDLRGTRVTLDGLSPVTNLSRLTRLAVPVTMAMTHTEEGADEVAAAAAVVIAGMSHLRSFALVTNERQCGSYTAAVMQAVMGLTGLQV